MRSDVTQHSVSSTAQFCSADMLLTSEAILLLSLFSNPTSHHITSVAFSYGLYSLVLLTALY